MVLVRWHDTPHRSNYFSSPCTKEKEKEKEKKYDCIIAQSSFVTRTTAISTVSFPPELARRLTSGGNAPILHGAAQ